MDDFSSTYVFAITDATGKSWYTHTINYWSKTCIILTYLSRTLNNSLLKTRKIYRKIYWFRLWWVFLNELNKKNLLSSQRYSCNLWIFSILTRKSLHNRYTLHLCNTVYMSTEVEHLNLRLPCLPKFKTKRWIATYIVQCCDFFSASSFKCKVTIS